MRLSQASKELLYRRQDVFRETNQRSRVQPSQGTNRNSRPSNSNSKSQQRCHITLQLSALRITHCSSMSSVQRSRAAMALQDSRNRHDTWTSSLWTAVWILWRRFNGQTGRCNSMHLPNLLLQLLTTSRYLKCIDRFYNNYVSCFITGGSKSFPSSSAIAYWLEDRCQIPSSTPTLSACYHKHHSRQHIDRCEPDITTNGRSDQTVFYGGLRELG